MTITVTDLSYKTPIYIDPTYIISVRPVSNGGAALTDIFGSVYSTVESPDQVIDLIEAEVAALNAYTETYFVPDVTQDEKDQIIADLNKEIEELENEVQELNDEISSLTDEDEDLSDDDLDDEDEDEDEDDYDDEDEDEDDDYDDYDDDLDSDDEDDSDDNDEFSDDWWNVLLGVFDKR